MQQKESLWEKIIRRFYGIDSPLNDYQRKQVNRIGNNAFLISFGYMLVSNVVVAFFAINHPLEVLISFMFVNILFTLALTIGYILPATNKLHLNVKEVSSREYPQVLKEIKWRAVRSGIGFGIYMWFFERALDWFLDGISFIRGLQSFHSYWTVTLGAIIFGLGVYVSKKLRLKKGV